MRESRVTYADMVDTWGEDGIFVASPAGLEGIRIPEDARNFLLEVGLPKFFDRRWAGAIFDSVSSPALVGSANTHCKLGVASGADICIELDSGNIVALSTSADSRVYFVNSSLASFVYFLWKFSGLRNSYVDSSDSEIKARADALAAELRIQDSQAFNDDEYWWPLIFEQVRNGFM